jgi:hypothetical protein
MRIANRQAAHYVRKHEEFNGSHLFAEKRPAGEGYRYAVFSYGHHWPLYVFDSEHEVWFGNKDTYSPTTSIHAGRSRPPRVDHWLDISSMLRVADEGYVGFVKHRLVKG